MPSHHETLVHSARSTCNNPQGLYLPHASGQPPLPSPPSAPPPGQGGADGLRCKVSTHTRTRAYAHTRASTRGRAHTGRTKRAHVRDTQVVHCVSWSPDGSTLLSGASDRTLRFWTLRSPDREVPFPQAPCAEARLCFGGAPCHMPAVPRALRFPGREARSKPLIGPNADWP